LKGGLVFSKAGLTRKILVGVLTGCLSYIAYYLIPLLAIRQIIILPTMKIQTVPSGMVGMELFNIWILLSLIILSVATSVFSENIIGVVIGASIPIVMIVYLMSLMNFGVLALEYLGYRVDIDITYILILLAISVVIWSIARVFRYVEGL
jgi:hypothetical protein